MSRATVPMERAEIERRIPHRDPFLFVDRVLSLEYEDAALGTARAPIAITGEWTVAPTRDFFQGHYPGFPVTPGVILCEHVLQTAALLLSERGVDFEVGAGVPVLARLERAKFRRMVRPGERVVTRVEMGAVVGPAFYLSGKAAVDGKAALELRAAMTHAAGTPA